MTVACHGNAVVDAGELNVLAEKDLWLREIELRRLWVQREADVVGSDIARVRAIAIGVRPPEKDVLIGQG